MYPCDNITLFYAKHKKKVEASEMFWLTFLNLIYQVDLSNSIIISISAIKRFFSATSTV